MFGKIKEKNKKIKKKKTTEEGFQVFLLFTHTLPNQEKCYTGAETQGMRK